MRPDRHHPTAAVNFYLPKRLDALTADGVYTQVHRILSRGARRLRLDAGAMAYISSKGIRTLLRLRDELHGDGGVLILENLQAFAQEVLRASGLGDDLTGLYGGSDMVVTFHRVEMPVNWHFTAGYAFAGCRSCAAPGAQTYLPYFKCPGTK